MAKWKLQDWPTLLRIVLDFVLPYESLSLEVTIFYWKFDLWETFQDKGKKEF